MPNDYAAVNFPGHQMVPLFEAVDTMQSKSSGCDVQWTSVDIITDRNNLLKLAGWADPGCSSERSSKNFRIDVQQVGPWTILFQRWEDQLMRWGGGFSETFEEASCRPGDGCKLRTQPGGTRVISYVSGPHISGEMVLNLNRDFV